MTKQVLFFDKTKQDSLNLDKLYNLLDEQFSLIKSLQVETENVIYKHSDLKWKQGYYNNYYFVKNLEDDESENDLLYPNEVIKIFINYL